MSDFFRFPHTAHLEWLGAGEPRDDKVMSPEEVRELLAGEVVVEEKLDGANLGLSASEDGELRAQNRGSYLTPEGSHPQFRTLWGWLGPREEALLDALWPDLMVFGEWCYAVHSVHYERLPEVFLAFDVYDRAAGRFWSTRRRDALMAELGLAVVPHVARGHFDVAGLKGLLGRSSAGDVPMEGVVVRREDADWCLGRGKLVRAEFTQAIEAHWSRGPLERNGLATDR